MEIYLHSNLKFFREKFDLSQEQIADLIEKKKSVIGHYERGTSLPPLDSLVRISTFFGITLDNLTLTDLRTQDEFITKFRELAHNNLSNEVKEPVAGYEVIEVDDTSRPVEERINSLKEHLKQEQLKGYALQRVLKKFTYLQSELIKQYDKLYYSKKK